jgi:hypothetical protein
MMDARALDVLIDTISPTRVVHANHNARLAFRKQAHDAALDYAVTCGMLPKSDADALREANTSLHERVSLALRFISSLVPVYRALSDGPGMMGVESDRDLAILAEKLETGKIPHAWRTQGV